MTTPPGLIDKHGNPIHDGDWVSLDGNMTADDSMGFLPNGWFFDETDVYQVYWDERIKNWALRLDCEPDSPENIKYMNHAVSLLHQGNAEIVPPPPDTVLAERRAQRIAEEQSAQVWKELKLNNQFEKSLSLLYGKVLRGEITVAEYQRQLYDFFKANITSDIRDKFVKLIFAELPAKEKKKKK